MGAELARALREGSGTDWKNGTFYELLHLRTVSDACLERPRYLSHVSSRYSVAEWEQRLAGSPQGVVTFSVLK